MKGWPDASGMTSRIRAGQDPHVALLRIGSRPPPRAAARSASGLALPAGHESSGCSSPERPAPPLPSSRTRRLCLVEHQFGGAPFTIGIEEELMILDAETLELVNAIEMLLEPAPSGEIKPELMESVLEVSTEPCANTEEAGEQLRALRRQVIDTAATKKLTIGSAG